MNHLADAIKQGLPVDIRRMGITSSLEDLITRTIHAPPVNNGEYEVSASRRKKLMTGGMGGRFCRPNICIVVLDRSGRI